MTPFGMAIVFVRAAEIREASYVKGDQPWTCGYAKKHEEAIKEALVEFGFPVDFSFPLSLSLETWWNDTLAWAQTIIDEKSS